MVYNGSDIQIKTSNNKEFRRDAITNIDTVVMMIVLFTPTIYV